MLYHLSDKYGLTELTPQIPKADKHVEESNTARICFAPSINCCLRGLQVDTHFGSGPNKYNVDARVDNEKDCCVNEIMLCMNMHELESMHISNYIEHFTQPFPLFHVYTPIDVNYKEFVVPTKTDVFDRDYTQEVWLLRPCKVERVATIMVVGAMDLFHKKFFFTDRVTGARRRWGFWVRDYEYRIVPDGFVEAREQMYKIIDKELNQNEKDS